MEKTSISVKESNGKWRAWKTDNPQIWGIGDDEKQAVGDLIFLHGQYIGLEIQFIKESK